MEGGEEGGGLAWFFELGQTTILLSQIMISKSTYLVYHTVKLFDVTPEFKK